MLVFIDESGLSQRPHRCRTWAPRGQTPVLQYNFNWKSLSVAAGLTLWNFYFRLYAGSVKKAQVVDFLQALVRHLRLPLLVV
ncbi:MAG: transposase [Limisphaerales bacterium]